MRPQKKKPGRATEAADDIRWMRQAIVLARKAEKAGEVPVGAVAVLNGRKIASGYNRPIRSRDPSAHAEMVCLRRAAKRLNNYRTADIILYVTLEPCPMCAGAMVWARVGKTVFGCKDEKAGACGTVLDLSRHAKLNHRFEVKGGVLEAECRSLLQDFFKKRRS